MGRGLWLFILLGFNYLGYAQGNPQLKDFQDYLKHTKPPGYDTTLQSVSYFKGGSIHYLYPLYQLMGEEGRFSKLLGKAEYYDMLSQSLAFVQDYESALDAHQAGYDSTVDEVSQRQISKLINGLKDVQHVDARRYISYLARNYSVIMINEAPDKPLHNAFTSSLLEDLYKKGYRYLAMEMLNNRADHSLDKLTPSTGHYSAEPVAGEMIRIALDMGYQLVSYEDTMALEHTPTERDSIQASNIYQVIKKDPAARILVVGTYGHIAERNNGTDYIPMGMAFKKMSGIDPLTIDQTDMTEGGDFPYGKAFYDTYMQKYNVSSSSIALVKDEPANITNNDLYDLSVIHPRTTYRDGRPTWLNMAGRRQPLYVKPAKKECFLVQAYYQFETFGNKPGQVIPADQTYIATPKGNYLLYLRRGKYVILFRDMNYKVLASQHIEVS